MKKPFRYRGQWRDKLTHARLDAGYELSLLERPRQRAVEAEMLSAHSVPATNTRSRSEAVCRPSGSD